MLILKQNAANTVPTPPAGKGTIFLNPSDDLAVKTADGTVATFPTAAGANTQVYFNDDGSFGATANFTFNKSTNVLTITGNITASNANLGNAATANFFIGSGNNLSNIQGANVTGAVATATTAGTVTTAAQPNITSVGTLTSLAVTGNISAGNVSATTFTGALSGAATSATTAGTVTTAAQPNITSIGTLSSLTVTGNASAGNVNAGNLLTANYVAGTLTTAAQPNITSVGTLTSAAVTGNVTAGNVYANSGTIGASLLAGTLTTAAQPNITSVGTLSSLTVTGNVAGGNLTTAGVLSVTGTGVSSIAGNLDMTSNTIINLATPTNSTDAATKQYVDDVAQGLNVHPSCNAATTTTLASISSGTVTYNNGTAGVGATLTTTGTYTTIDGVTLSDGMRILVKNEVASENNGIYVRTSATVLTRATDFDTAVEIAGGDFTFVTAGTQYNSTGWVQIDEVTTVGTDPIVWEQFSGAGTYQAGTGLTLTGSVFSVNASQTQVTSVGTLGSLAVTGNANVGNLNTGGTVIATGNISANFFIGNGSQLTGIDATTIQNGTANVRTFNNANVTVSAAGTANIAVFTGTGANVAGTLNATGNANVGNLGTGGLITATGNVSGANLISTAYTIASVGTGISAAGTAQGNATAIGNMFNAVSTVASGAGVVLPTAVAGMRISVINTSANALLVYPASSAAINSASVNVAYSQPAGARLDYISTSSSQWYTLNATYG
jgi:hypothetical protein